MLVPSLSLSLSLYTYVYIYSCTYVYIHIYACTYVCMHIHICICVPMYIYIYVLHTNIHMCVYTHAFMQIYICIWDLLEAIGAQGSHGNRGCLHLGPPAKASSCQFAHPTVHDPEGPSSQYLRTLVPKAIKAMVLGTRDLTYWVLGPSGYMRYGQYFRYAARTWIVYKDFSTHNRFPAYIYSYICILNTYLLYPY